MAIISIANHKGGTGKTTTTIHLAAAMALRGLRVLTIDLDPQGFLTHALGVAEPEPEKSSLAFWMGIDQLTDIPIQKVGKLDLIPASGAMTRAMRKMTKPTDVLWIREILAQGHPYDHILIDTAAAVTVYSLSALVASKVPLIPVTPEYQPVVGAEQTYQTCRMVQKRLNPALEEPLFLFTRVDARKRSHFMYRNYLRKRYADRIMNTIIRTSTSLADLKADGTTVFDHNLFSRGAIDYANAADELLQHLATPVSSTSPSASSTTRPS